MATFNSDQVTKLLANPPRRLPAQDGYAPSFKLNFTFNTGATGMPTTAAVTQLVKLPNGSRIADYWFGFQAMGAGITLDLGITGDTQRYLAALSIAAAGEKRAAFVKDKMPDQTAIANDTTFLVGTWGGGTAAASQVIQGW